MRDTPNKNEMEFPNNLNSNKLRDRKRTANEFLRLFARFFDTMQHTDVIRQNFY